MDVEEPQARDVGEACTVVTLGKSEKQRLACGHSIIAIESKSMSGQS